MSTRFKSWFNILYTAAKNWSADNAFKHSAAVSFYTLFSLAPITVIAVGIAGFFVGKDEASRQFQGQMTQLLGKAGADTIQQAVQASTHEEGNWVSTVTGLVLVVIGATTVFGQLQESLNAIWNVKSKPSRSGWAVMLMQRVVSFAMVMTVGFILLVSLIVTTALSSVTQRWGGDLAPVLAQGSDLLISIGVITLLFSGVFKILPDVQLRWRDVMLSAFLTALLFTGGRYLIALYLSHSTVASIYGAAGSLVALLIWVYYSCAILFYGVEFSRAHRMAHGLKVIPKSTAVLVHDEVVEGRPTPRVKAKAPATK